MTTKEDVNKVFRLLRKAGYFAKQNFWCCQTCGWSAVPEDSDKVVFYHNQDNDAWGHSKVLQEPLYLAWIGSGKEIIFIIESVGLKVAWDGSDNKRIQILP